MERRPCTLEATGRGQLALYASHGTLFRFQLAQGEEYSIDPRYLVAWTTRVSRDGLQRPGDEDKDKKGEGSLVTPLPQPVQSILKEVDLRAMEGTKSLTTYVQYWLLYQVRRVWLEGRSRVLGWWLGDPVIRF